MFVSLLPSARRRALARQRLHTAGTCPDCRGRGSRVVTGVPSLMVLPCGTCGGTGSSR